MGEPAEKFTEQEISELQLQLNACQQTIASLELKIRQKEEIIIKANADTKKQEMHHRAEIGKLKEQIKETSQIIENTSNSNIEEALRQAKERESKALNDLHEVNQKYQKMNQILEDYEKTITKNATEYKNLCESNETVKGHLATLEVAFHDVIQKYERTKSMIEAYKENEELLQEKIELSETAYRMETQRYESLKAHAKTQIEKANKENSLLKGELENVEVKQNAIIKRLEIKIASLENALEHKTKECAELAALCDEVTGKKV